MVTSTVMKKLSMAAAGAVFMALGTVASAQAATFGGKIFSTGGKVEVEILPGNPNAGYTSELRLYSPDNPQGEFIGTSREPGKVVDLGSFAAGQELLFGIFVRNTRATYYMGPAERNRDGVVHNTLDEIAPGVINVAFEDLWAGGDRSYNDLAFQFRGAVDDTPATSVPEPTSVMGLLAFGAIGASSMLKRKQQQTSLG